jgi:outer membrane protein
MGADENSAKHRNNAHQTGDLKVFLSWRAEKISCVLRSIVFLILILSFFPSGSSAQKLWTLEECMARAYESNIQLKRAELSQQLSEYSVLQSKMNFFPGLSASTGYYFNYGKTIDPTTNNFVTQNTQTNSWSINGNLGLFNGFQRWNTLRQNEYNVLASEANTQGVSDNVSLYTVGGFLDIIYAKENLKVAEEQLQLSKDQLERTRRLVEAGSLPQSSIYDIEAQAAQSEVARVTAENELDIARLNLTQLLTLPEPIDILVPAIDMTAQLSEMNKTVKDIYDTALVTQPAVRGAEYRLKSAEKGLSISRGALYPSLYLFGSLTTNYSNLYKRFAFDTTQIQTIPVGFVITDNTPVVNYAPSLVSSSVSLFDQYSDNFGQAFGFSLEIPIFNNWANRTNVSRAKVNVLDAKYDLEATRQQLLTDVQKAYADARAAKNSYEAALKAEASYRQSFNDAQAKFNAGAINSLDFTTIKNNFSKSQSDLLRAKYQYLFQLKLLDFYQGKPLTLQ